MDGEPSLSHGDVAPPRRRVRIMAQPEPIEAGIELQVVAPSRIIPICGKRRVGDRIMVKNKGAGTVADTSTDADTGKTSYQVFLDSSNPRRKVEVRPNDVEGEAWNSSECKKFREIVKRLAENIKKSGNEDEIKALLCNEVIQLDRSFAYTDEDDHVLNLLEREHVDGRLLMKLDKEKYLRMCECLSEQLGGESPGPEKTRSDLSARSPTPMVRKISSDPSIYPPTPDLTNEQSYHTTATVSNYEMRKKAIRVIWEAIEGIQERHKPYRFSEEETKRYERLWAGMGDEDDEEGFNTLAEEDEHLDDWKEEELDEQEVPAEDVAFDRGDAQPEADGSQEPPLRVTCNGRPRELLESRNRCRTYVLAQLHSSNYRLPRPLIELDVRRYGVFYFAYVVNQLTIRSNDDLWLLLNFLALRMETSVVIRLINYFIQIFSRFDPDDCKVLYLCKAIVSGSKHPIGTSLLMAAFMEELGNLDRQSRDMYVGGKEEDLEKKIGCGNFQEFFIEGASELLEAIESDHLALMTLECPTDIVGGKIGYSAFDIAIRFKLSEFMASSRIKRITTTIWSKTNPLDPTCTFRAKEINCCDYGVGLLNCYYSSDRQQGPFKWFVTPYGKYITEILAYLAFVFFFLMSTIMRRSIYDEFDYLEAILYVCIFSFTIKEIWDLKGDMRAYCTNIQNWTDMVIILTFGLIVYVKLEEKFEWAGPTECDNTCARFCHGNSASSPYVAYPFSEAKTLPSALPEGAYANEGAEIYSNPTNRNPIITFYDGGLDNDEPVRVDLRVAEEGGEPVDFDVYYARWGTLYGYGTSSATASDADADTLAKLKEQAGHMKKYTSLFHPAYYDAATGTRREGQQQVFDIFGDAVINHCDDGSGLCGKPNRIPCEAYTIDDGELDYEQFCPASNLFHEDDGSIDYGPEPVGWFFNGQYLRYTDCSIAHADHPFCSDFRENFEAAPGQGDCMLPENAPSVIMENLGWPITSCGQGIWHYQVVDCQATIMSGRSLTYKAIWSLIILFHVWRVLFFLRIFDAMGRFHKICIYMLRPLVVFFVFLMLVCLGFSVVFFYVAGDTAVQSFYRLDDAVWWTIMAVQGDMDVEPVTADNAWDYGDQMRVGIYSALHEIANNVDGVDVGNLPYGIEGPPELQNIDEGRSVYLRSLMYLFLCVGCVMLLNLLIAVMATVYEEFQEDAYNELQFERGRRAIHMDRDSGMLPAPFNIMPIAALITWNILELFLILCSWYIDLVPFGKLYKKQKEDSRVRGEAMGEPQDTLRGSAVGSQLTYDRQEDENEECCTFCAPLGCQLKRGPDVGGCCGRVRGAYRMVWQSSDGKEGTWWCVYCNSFVEPLRHAKSSREFYNTVLENYYQKYEEDMAPLDSGDKQKLNDKRPELCPACYRNKATQTRTGVQTEIVSFCSFMLVLYVPFLILLMPLWIGFRIQRVFTKSRFKATMTSEIGETLNKLVMPHTEEVERDFSKDDKYTRLMKGPYSNHHIWRCAQKSLGVRLRFEDIEKNWENNMRHQRGARQSRRRLSFIQKFGFELDKSLQVINISMSGNSIAYKQMRVTHQGEPLKNRSIATAGVQKGDAIIECVCSQGRFLVHNKCSETRIHELLHNYDMCDSGPIELVFCTQGRLAVRNKIVEGALGKELTATTARFDQDTKDWLKKQIAELGPGGETKARERASSNATYLQERGSVTRTQERIGSIERTLEKLAEQMGKTAGAVNGLIDRWDEIEGFEPSRQSSQLRRHRQAGADKGGADKGGNQV